MSGKLGMYPIRWAHLNQSYINCYQIMRNRQDVEWFSAIGHLSKISPRGCAKKEKIRDYYGSGWVGSGLTRNFFVENHPKTALNLYRYFGVVGLYLMYYGCIYIVKLLVIMIWVFCPCQWWVSKNKIWMGGWWVGWALSNFFFWNCFIFAKPLTWANEDRTTENKMKRRVSPNSGSVDGHATIGVGD